jgi:hypothetical protein
MMASENHYFCAILQGCAIFFFDGLSKIHSFQMNLDVKKPWQIIILRDIKSSKLKLRQIRHYLLLYKKNNLLNKTMNIKGIKICLLRLLFI